MKIKNENKHLVWESMVGKQSVTIFVFEKKFSSLVIVSDSNNMLLWHESEDIKKTKQKIKEGKTNQFIQLYVYKLSLGALALLHRVDYCVKLILVDKTLCENYQIIIFVQKWFNVCTSLCTCSFVT